MKRRTCFAGVNRGVQIPVILAVGIGSKLMHKQRGGEAL